SPLNAVVPPHRQSRDGCNALWQCCRFVALPFWPPARAKSTCSPALPSPKETRLCPPCSMWALTPTNKSRKTAPLFAYPPPRLGAPSTRSPRRSEEHTSELQSRENLVCRLLLE